MAHFANTAQAEAWNGYEGEHWARSQDRWDAVNEGFNQPLLDAAGIAETDGVLDVGCGAGRTTRLAARRARRGQALGLDLSGPMLTKARESAVRERVKNVAFHQGDAQVHAFDAEGFDAVISRYGMTFFADPAAAFANLHHALRPGGRLAFICAAEAEANQWLEALASLEAVVPLGGFGKAGGPGMFSLTDPDRIRTLVTAGGFTDVDVQRIEVPGNWGADAQGAAAFLLGSGPGRHLLSQATPQQQTQARRTLTDVLGRYESDGAVWLRSSSWMVTAVRGGAALN
ncbi:class I SAM-dependent methyltransferase [Streptomyces sp. NPDC058701]|uniref:class I SAM-dependent methyltransferase n=1 Tax=Streptomyces sp. NPDC058701 TaxID=3346608 RepID=UPI0036461096